MTDDSDLMGLLAEIKRAERERDWMPILLLAMGCGFGWLAGENVFSWEDPTVFRFVTIVGVIVILREVLQIRVMLLRSEHARSRGR